MHSQFTSHCNIPTLQTSSAGLGLHPFTVHTDIITSSGTRFWSHLKSTTEPSVVTVGLPTDPFRGDSGRLQSTVGRVGWLIPRVLLIQIWDISQFPLGISTTTQHVTGTCMHARFLFSEETTNLTGRTVMTTSHNNSQFKTGTDYTCSRVSFLCESLLRTFTNENDHTFGPFQ